MRSICTKVLFFYFSLCLPHWFYFLSLILCMLAFYLCTHKFEKSSLMTRGHHFMLQIMLIMPCCAAC